MLFCIDTDAPYSCIGDKLLERIVCHFGRRCIPIIDSKRDFKFGDALVKSRGMVELMLPTPGSILDIQVILDLVDVKILTVMRIRRYRRKQHSCLQCNQLPMEPHSYQQ